MSKKNWAKGMTLFIFFCGEKERGFYFGIEHTPDEVQQMIEGGATVIRCPRTEQELEEIPCVY